MEDFKNLKREVKKDIEDKYTKFRLRCETEEGLKEAMQWEGKTYKTNPKQKFLRWLENKEATEIKRKLTHIQEIENAPDNLANDLIITIEWRPSRMWRSNPKAYTNYGFESRSIGGCGYDKLSTATAEALNSQPTIIKSLYKAKDIILSYPREGEINHNDLHRKYLDYGAGYGILPIFESGVGVSCHKRILEKIGYTMECVTDTPNINVYQIKKKVA